MALDKIADPSAAARMYANTAKAADAPGVSGGDGPSFSDFLRSGLTDSLRAVKAGEQASAQAIMGKADVTDVVQAITQAEATLQTVVAVRDRLINAYQELLRMPI